jgi:hypothetical protein
MRANKVSPVGIGQVRTSVPHLGVACEPRQGVVQLVPIGQELFLPPSLSGVAKDIHEVLLSCRRKP